MENKLFELWMQFYNAMFIEKNMSKAQIAKANYQTACVDNNINPHTSIVLQNMIDNFIGI